MHQHALEPLLSIMFRVFPLYIEASRVVHRTYTFVPVLLGGLSVGGIIPLEFKSLFSKPSHSVSIYLLEHFLSFGARYIKYVAPSDELFEKNMRYYEVEYERATQHSTTVQKKSIKCASL